MPLILASDAPVWEWRRMSRTVRLRRHSRRLFAACEALERRALLRADVVFAYTKWARDRLLDAAPGATIRERTPGVDLTHFRPAARRPRDRPRLLFVGSRFAEKGGHDLLAAVGHLLGTEVDLDVVTREPLAARPGLRIHRLGRSDRELLDLVQQADLFCLPTYADTMSFAAMEALACGTPAVVSAVGGVPEVVGDAGVVVPPGDRRALRGAIEALVADPARLAALGPRAREIAEQRFDARVQTDALIEAARELVARRAGVRRPQERVAASAARFEIAVLCTGNRFRSPLSAALIRGRAVGLPVDVTSAAVTATQGPALVQALELAGPLGVTLDDHVARVLVSGELAPADLVLGFERQHVAAAVVEGGAHRERAFTLPEFVSLAEQLPAPAVADPMERARTIVRGAAALRAEAGAAARPAEIADPFGGPEQGYREAAAAVADLSDRLVRVLFGSR
jgi:protein-tyrosine-phosphatase